MPDTMARLRTEKDGRYVVGPKFGKAHMLRSFGGVDVEPCTFPPPSGRAWVAVMETREFDAALWVDEHDYNRVVRSIADENAPVTWIEMDEETMIEARRCR